MTDSMIVEAVRAAGGTQSTMADMTSQVAAVADPQAVARFDAAMSTGSVHGVRGADPIPFASEMAVSWRSAIENNQGILHRIRALTDLRNTHSPASLELMELQYEVMNLSFQQEVVTKVADKSSNAIQTLIKNQ